MLTRGTVLAVLLVLSTALFAVGAIAERNSSDPHSGESAASSPAHREEADAGEAAEGPGETGPAESSDAARESSAGPESHSNNEAERLLGVDLESRPLIVLAIVFGLALAAAVALGKVRRRRELLLLVAAVAAVWAALDVREFLHQVGESRTGIATIAAAVATSHTVAAALAAQLSRQRDVT